MLMLDSTVEVEEEEDEKRRRKRIASQSKFNPKGELDNFFFINLMLQKICYFIVWMKQTLREINFLYSITSSSKCNLCFRFHKLLFS